MKSSKTKNIGDRLQYLVGVPAQYIAAFESYNKGTMQKVRRLSALRSTIIERFTDINAQFRAGHPLKEITETARLVADLEKVDITLTPAHSLSRHVVELNSLIETHIEPLTKLFDPIPEEWIKELFVMPNGDTTDGVRVAIRRYRQYKNCHPYQKYINWSFHEMTEEQRAKNIFAHDEELIALLREAHSNKVSRLFDFIGTGSGVVVVVDCENSDAQRLYDALLPMQSSISKIVLVDDSHTNTMWELLASDFRASGVVVEHDELARLKEQKSLVDLRVVAKTCEEHYKNNVQDFVLASSDSDIWALITSLPDANILVLAEKCKCGDVFIEALTRQNIKHLFMEDVVKDSTSLADRVMYATLSQVISEQYVDVRRLVLTAAQRANLYLSPEALERYANTALEEIHATAVPETGKLVFNM